MSGYVDATARSAAGQAVGGYPFVGADAGSGTRWADYSQSWSCTNSSAPDPSLPAGGRMSYTIRVSDPTGGTARNVKTCDRLSAGLVYVGSRSKARLTGGACCWTASRLAGGASRRYRITVQVLRGASGSRVNRATVNGVQARPRKARAAIRVLPARSRGGGVTG